MDHEMKDTDRHILHKVNLCVISIHYPKYDIHLSNNVQILSKITGPRNTGHWPTYNDVNLCLSLFLYPTHDVHPSDTPENHWTMKYRSLTYIYFMRSIFVPYWSIIPSITLLHQIVFKILSLITGLPKIGHWSTYISWSQSLCHTDAFSKIWLLSIK